MCLTYPRARSGSRSRVLGRCSWKVPELDLGEKRTKDIGADFQLTRMLACATPGTTPIAKLGHGTIDAELMHADARARSITCTPHQESVAASQ